MNSRRGFTILEIVIFVGIFSIVIVGFLTVFVAVSQIQVRQAASAEVASQSQFLLQIIQYYVERSSAIDIPADVGVEQLVLRMPAPAEDPLYIFREDDRIVLDYGTSSRALTSNKVKITNITFTKRANLPGHDSVAVAFTVEYNSENLKQKAVQIVRTAIVRVSAATFDSNVNSGSPTTYSLGTASGEWRSINGTVYFSGSNVGIGIAAPATALQLAGGDMYLSSSSAGIILKASNGTTCLKLTASTTAGVLLTASVACP